MTLASGTKLGPYEIGGQLGAGGMGEVYRARDTRLERTVAVKVLPSQTAASPEARQRFEREAKTISQLSHPHICALYDVGSQDGVEYLVMELLEGETLSDRLARGPLPLEQTVRFGQEIADALDKAHRQGIVHRDLKPANVMLTKSGVKLLDFGLAKATEAPASKGSVTSLPTQQGLTQEGTILGTFQYMAPEQLEGKEADARTDIFALGAVLYEMATGKKAFSASSQASLITAIMSADPPSIAAVQPMSPAALDRVVRTCLAKDPEERWQSAADIKRELKWIGEGSAAGVAVPAAVASRRRSRERLAWTVAALALLGGVALLASRRAATTPPAVEPVRFSMAPPPGHVFTDTIVLSPNGRRVLLNLRDVGGNYSVWTRSLDDLAVRHLPGTDATRYPMWSPDGRDVAFFSEGKLKRMSAEGGPIQKVCESGSGFGGSWNREGTILFTKEFGTPIVAVSASGGDPRPVTELDASRGDVAHFFPEFLPDGRHFVFVARNLDPEKTEVRLSTLGEKGARALFHADSAAIYADPGYLLFARDNAVFAWRFDAKALRLEGEATPAFETALYRTEDNRLCASAAAGSVAYLQWSPRRRLVWVDRKGRELQPVGDVAFFEDLRISPDGRRVAVARRDSEHGQNLDLWVYDLERGTGSRITSSRTDEFSPLWLPGGDRLVYVSDRGGSGFYDLYEHGVADGVDRTLLTTKNDKVLPSLSRDGRVLVFGVAEDAVYRTYVMAMSAGEPRRLSAPSRFSEVHPEVSPDGLWVAFDSNESGQQEVYVVPVSGGARIQASVGGGMGVFWRRDGRELFYVGKDGVLMSVPFETVSGRARVADPQPLFTLNLGGSGINTSRRPYDVAPDGERFLIIRSTPEAPADDAVVVLNWRSVLARKGSP
ncbi:MAG TPA: protein kinase [Thermoanaerobaculia bacterium]|nr:protein kinase [Thermoanaerobaculia bacterium]